MTFKWMTNWDEIWSDEFVGQWQNWMKKSNTAHAFFHPSMVKAWVDTYGEIEDIKPMFCVVEVDDSVIFFPLVLWEKNWRNAYVKSIIPAGNSVFDYLTPLYVKGSKKIDWNIFWNDLVQNIDENFSHEYDVMEFTSVPKKYSGKEWVVEDVCPYSDISMFSSKDEFIKSRKSSFRHTIKRRMRRLGELEEVEFKIIEDVEEALDYLPELLSWHRNLWPNAYKAPLFHENLIKNALSSGIMHFSILFVDKKPISYVLSFIYNGRYYHYMSAYDLSYRSLSIGNLHILYLFEDCIEKDFTIYDLLRGDEKYKFDWTTDSENVCSFKKINNKLSTKVKLALISLKEKVKG